MNTDYLDAVLDQFTLEQRKAAVDELGRLLDAAVQPNGMELLAAFLNDLGDDGGASELLPDDQPHRALSY
jgi:hypothetical protein